MRSLRPGGLTLAMLALVLAACAGQDPATSGSDAGAGADGSVAVRDNCPALFAQDLLPEYSLEIAPAEWAALTDEFLHRAAREAAGLDHNPYHSVVFRYQGGAPVPGVLLRLHGESSWRQAVALDPHPKMQFTIAFNEVDKEGRFMGVRKVDLDMPRTDLSFLRQRLALYYLRGMSVDAQCANNARLVINGAYYGLYTNLEHPDKEYLQRTFPGASDGDLWKGGRTLETNKDTFSWNRLDAFWKVDSTAALAALSDLPASVREWATESVIPDGDGFYGGGHNYYLYDHPTRGFVWLPQDLDSTFDFRSADIGPIFWSRTTQPTLHYLLVMNDPVWQDRFVTDLAEARAGYHVADLQAQVDKWSAQIASAAADDAMKPFTTQDHVAAIAHLRTFIADRAAFMDAWLACRAGSGVDADGDGVDFCHDCDDSDPTAHPGASETCNKKDDDCNGKVDDLPVACAATP